MDGAVDGCEHHYDRDVVGPRGGVTAVPDVLEREGARVDAPVRHRWPLPRPVRRAVEEFDGEVGVVQPAEMTTDLVHVVVREVSSTKPSGLALKGGVIESSAVHEGLPACSIRADV
ncbi:hypothetical protein BEL07_13085 [Mycolicibacterium grossiae]|uniref:Uncharacterized protein n=1 Tax=Mycolicibacterium grossiae TaxID=1552759 RepID=A0A1E8Q5D8_9MYCO|nr:hypothetical protein BEL07_13085 [Mycolicibacterium grossiae]